MKNIENIVFKGGGVKGIAYAGVIYELENNNLLDQVKRVAGTSAGAITATLLSLRYNAQEIHDIINGTDFKSFEDHKNVGRILTKYGMYRGDAFLEWMKKIVADKLGSPNATFQDLKDAGMRDLQVFSCDLNLKALRTFSAEETPTTIVAEAARASMSIPLFFKAWKFPSGIPDDHVYVDGGTVYNYPVTAFDQEGYNDKTLGFFLNNVNKKVVDNNLDYDHVIKYIEYLFETLMTTQTDDLMKDKQDLSRTVIVDDHGISGTNFGLTTEQKDLLYNSGRQAVTDYLKSQSAS